MDIKHAKTTNSRAYEDGICELWIDLPSGGRLYFSAIDCDGATDEDDDRSIEEAKVRILAGLCELMSAHQ